MAKYLLDTHIWLWMHTRPDLLRSEVVRELRAPQNELWLSPISLWEVLLLVERRRLRLTSEPLSWIEGALATTPVTPAVITMEIAMEVYRFPLAHRDPGDRFLVASARLYELTLVTADETLLELEGLSKLAN